MGAPPRNPYLTVDIVIEIPGRGVALVERGNDPLGWAIPGGFVDYGEAAWRAAEREAREETGLEVDLVEQFFTYSEPGRDPRFHTASVVFLARAEGEPRGGDDARRAQVFPLDALPDGLCFDHGRILADVAAYRRTGRRPAPRS